MSAVSMMSFTENGTPMSAPARSERSRARASAMA
jgi:hypothetical protein